MKLIVAPHADDEALGCGGLLARFADDCVLAVLSDKQDGRMEEFHVAKEALGYKTHFQAPFSTGSLSASMRDVVTWLDTLTYDLQPSELYLPAPDMHQDHIAAYEAGMRTSRTNYTGKHWSTPTIYLYEVPSYDIQLYPMPHPWNTYLELSAEDVSAKETAIAAYASQLHGDDFHPAKRAREYAATTGSLRGLQYAERYALVRTVLS